MIPLRLLRIFHRSRVGRDPHDLLTGRFWFFEKFDRVVVTLRHFLAVGARHLRRSVERFGLRQHERLAELMIEAAGEIATDFDMLHLIGPDRHDIGVVRENVGGH